MEKENILYLRPPVDIEKPIITKQTCNVISCLFQFQNATANSRVNTDNCTETVAPKSFLTLPSDPRQECIHE